MDGLQHRPWLICIDLCSFQVQMWLVRQTKGAPTAYVGRRGAERVSSRRTGSHFCYVHALYGCVACSHHPARCYVPRWIFDVENSNFMFCVCFDIGAPGGFVYVLTFECSCFEFSTSKIHFELYGNRFSCSAHNRHYQWA